MSSTDALRANHRDLSAVAERFLDYVQDHSEDQIASWKIDGFPNWMRDMRYPLQPMPLFVDQTKVGEIEEVTVGIWKLVREIPERLFQNNARRFSEAFGLHNEMLAYLLLEPPNGLRGSLVRCDLIDTVDGFKCLEVNGGNIGGWQLRFCEAMYLQNPKISRFLDLHGVDAKFRDPLHHVYRHAFDYLQATGRLPADRLNLAFTLEAGLQLTKHIEAAFNDEYQRFLSTTGKSHSGEVRLCSYADHLTVRGDRVYSGDFEVDAIVEHGSENIPQEIFRCFKSGGVALLGGPLAAVLNNKKNLVLLSEAETSSEFDAAEQRFIRRHIPWSRQLQAGPVTYRDESHSLLELLVAERERFVIKPLLGHSGQGVAVGRFTEPSAWQAVVRERAKNESAWLAQEFVQSRELYCSLPSGRLSPYDSVWGTFCFGDTYSGGFMRMMPRDTGDGVVNAGRGAEEGMILEV